MFDFIRKPTLWDTWDRKLDFTIGTKRQFSLKTIQDLAVYNVLQDVRDKWIAEIGGGHSRLLPRLAKTNRCFNIDKFEGLAGGPAMAKYIWRVKNIRAYLGDQDPALTDGMFDLLFSISVVEHVPTDRLAAFHADQLRILKPGGLFLHAIDLYLEDRPALHTVERFEHYRAWVTGTAGVEPIGPVFDGDCRFTCDLATNPDDVMYAWGEIAPQLTELRQHAQSVSLLLGGRKL